MPPLVLGTAYYPDHWPQSDWARDLRLIRDSGVDAVRFGEFSWSWFEPEPGQFNFRAYDHFLALAEQVGLRVMLCTPTCNPPRWLLARYPDVRLVDQFGLPHTGHRHMTNYHHPAAAEAAERAVRRLAERYAHHPAVYSWQIDNELTAGESADPRRIYDYHPLTIARYQAYLQNQYATLDSLNERWMNNFWSNQVRDWSEIDPPRPGQTISINPSAWLAWCRFREQNVADLASKQIAWLRSVDPHACLATNIPDLSPLLGVWLGQDYWALSRSLDLVGLTRYNYSGDPQAEYRALAYSLDVIRGAAQAASARFGVLEIQAGPHILPWRMTFAGGMWTPDFLQRSIENCAMHGAEEIYLFLWRAVRGGAEVGMNSLAHMDGSPSERTRRLPAIKLEAESARSRLDGRPTAWLHYSQDSLRLGALFDPDATADRSLPGWHALLEDLGFRVNVVDDAGLERRLLAGSRDLVILPYSLVLPAAVRQALAILPDSGPQQVWASFATGFFDEDGCAMLNPPGHGLIERLGAGFTGFDCDRPLSIPGLPPSAGLVGQACLSSGEITRQRGPLSYISFDLGTYYAGLPSEDQKSVRNWVQETLRLK